MNYKGGVCRSDDGGKTWKQSNKGMDETGATHILLDPDSPVDNRVLYVAGFGRGVYKSSDGGRTWSLKNQGITQTQPFAWRLARSSDGVLYALDRATFGRWKHRQCGRRRPVSLDGRSRTLAASQLPEGSNAPNGLAIDPRLAQIACTLPCGHVPQASTATAAAFSFPKMRGKTWKQVLEKDRHIYDITIDPSDSEYFVRGRIRVFGVALGRSRSDTGRASPVSTSSGASAWFPILSITIRSTSPHSAAASGTVR